MCIFGGLEFSGFVVNTSTKPMSHKEFFIALIILFFYSFSIVAQNNPKTDSLIEQIVTMPDGVEKVNTLLRVSRLMMNYQLDNSMNYAQKAEELAINLSYTEGIVNSLLQQTRIYTQKGNLDSARIRINTSLYYLEADTNFPQLLAKTNFYAGNVYNESNDFNKAASHYIEALEYFEKTKRVKLVAGLLNNLGNICIALDDNEKAIEYFEKAKKILTNDSGYYAAVIYNLGNAYKNTGNNKQALECFFEALKIEQKAFDSVDIAKTYNGIGIVYKNMADYDKAFDNLYKALEIKEKLGNPKYIASTLNNIAAVKMINKDYQEAVELSKRSYELAKSVNAKREVLYALEDIFEGYEQLSQYKDALFYYKLYYNEKDSAFYRDEASKSLIYKYEIKAKNDEIKLQAAESKNKTYFIAVLGLIILIAGVLVYFYFKNQKNKNLQRIIQERADEAENQKRRFAKDLHDSTGSNLTGIRLQLLALKDQQSLDSDTVTGLVDEVDRTHQGVRLLAYQASPPEFDNYTLDEAVGDLVRRLTKTGSIKIHFSNVVTINWLQVNNDFQLAIYRIIQEALSNIVKHSEANNVDIQIIQHDASLNVMIEDDGKGFDVATENKGLGLRNIKERTANLNGICKIDSNPGSGTSIIINLPLPEEAE